MKLIERHKEKNSIGLDRTLDLMSDGTVLIRGFSQNVVINQDENKTKITAIELQGGDYFDNKTTVKFNKKTVRFVDFEIIEDEYSELYSLVKIKVQCKSASKKEIKQLEEFSTEKEESKVGEYKELDEDIADKQLTGEDVMKMTDDEIIEKDKKEPGFFRKITKNWGQ